MTLITLIFADQKERILPQINADTRGSKIVEIAKPITTKDTKNTKVLVYLPIYLFRFLVAFVFRRF